MPYKVQKTPAEKGIPIPKANLGKPCTYPWRTMEIGESFVSKKMMHGTIWTKRTGRTFTTRKVTENGEELYRIWRLS